MRISNLRILGAALAATIIAAGLVGCGTDAGDSELAVSAAPLTAGVTDVIFTVQGDGIADGLTPYLGTRGSNPVGGASTASFLVPEGSKWLSALGFEWFVPAGPGFPPTLYRLRDQCSSGAMAFIVQSRVRRSVSLSCGSLPVPVTGTIGVERIILNGDYEFDPSAPDAGSFDGSNITRVILDGAPANAQVTVPTPSHLLGCFLSLPTVWPAPADWPSGSSACIGMTDANGDFVAYLVAKPGTSGTTAVDRATIQGVSDFYRYAVRIGGLARLEAVAQ